jgi:hypothetical protein
MSCISFITYMLSPSSLSLLLFKTWCTLCNPLFHAKKHNTLLSGKVCQTIIYDWIFYTTFDFCWTQCDAVSFFAIKSVFLYSGRAGRDGDAAECILFYSYKDKQILERMIRGKDPFTASIQRKIDQLYGCLRYCEDDFRCRRTMQVSNIWWQCNWNEKLLWLSDVTVLIWKSIINNYTNLFL